MAIFEGCRESWEAAPPRPWLLVVRDAVGLSLAMVCAVSLVIFLYAVM